MDPAKVRAVTNGEPRQPRRNSKPFLGFVNFLPTIHQKTMPRCPKTHSLNGKIPWEWTDEQQTTFDALKQAITREPILHLPLDDLPYKIEVDGSLVAMGLYFSNNNNNNGR